MDKIAKDFLIKKYENEIILHTEFKCFIIS